MKKITKILPALLIVATICTGVLPLFASAEDAIVPYYLNTTYCNCYFAISQGTGTGTATVAYQAQSDAFSYATITVKIQKRFLGIFWSTVDEWTETCYDVTGTVYNATALEDTGTYRAVFTVEIYGKDGSVDTIEDKITSTYE